VSLLIIFDSVAVIGGLLLAVGPFVGRLRSGAAFLRTQIFFAGIVTLVWSLLGLYVHSHGADAPHSPLPWPQYWRLMQLRWILAGSGATLLLTMFANPQFHDWRRAKHAKA